MKLLKEMSLIKHRVKSLLKAHPHLRDSDNKLIANIWYKDLVDMGLKPASITAMNFLFFYGDKQLTNAETIRRVRQKIQEENPELRGTVNEARQKEGEEVRKTI